MEEDKLQMRTHQGLIRLGLLAATSAVAAPPTPSMPMSSPSEAALAKAQAESDRLLAALRRQVASLPQGSRERAETARRLAAIEDGLRARSRVRYVSPATPGVWKAYDEAVSRRVEQQGHAHFPTVDGRKLYGRLIVNLRIAGDGQVVSVDVARGSGNPTLDRLARDIAFEAGPFPPFDQAMRQDADEVVITAPFDFVHHE
jgi:protein TonB